MFRLLCFLGACGCAFLAHRYFISWESLSPFCIGLAVAGVVLCFLAVRK